MSAQYVVIGGGLTGLSSALFLKLKNIKNSVTLIEASGRLGGWVRSNKFQDGSVHELGPRTIRMQSTSINYLLNLIDNVNIIDEIIPISKNNQSFNNRYIFANKELNLLDLSLLKPAQKPFTESMLLKLVKAALQKYEHENNFQDLTVDYFVRTRFGNEIADYVVNPVIRGIYACDSKDLGIQSTFPSLIEREKLGPNIVIGSLRHYLNNIFESKDIEGSVNSNNFDKLIKEASVFSFKGGLETLIQAIKKKLEDLGVNIILNSPVLKLNLTKSNKLNVTNIPNLICDHAILATPSFISSKLLMGLFSNYELLNKIHWNNIAVVVLEYKGRLIPYQGFGHLIPSWEIDDTLGVIYDSCILPENDSKEYETTRYTVMLGGAWYYPNIDQLNSIQLIEKAKQVLKTQIGVEGELNRSTVAVNNKCIPVYGLKHFELVNTIRKLINEEHLPIHLCGNSYDGVSLSDCVYSAHKVVNAIAT